MPQLDIELVNENIFAFYVVFIYLFGNQIVLNIYKNSLVIKLVKYFLETFNIKTLYLKHESNIIRGWQENILLK